MSCFFDGFYENRLTLCRKPLEDARGAPTGAQGRTSGEPKVNEMLRVAGLKSEVKIEKEKEKKVDPTERLKKAIKKEIKIQPKKNPPVRVYKDEEMEEMPKLDTIIKNLINEAEDTTIEKLFNIIMNKLEGENLMIKNIRNKRKFIINLL